MQQFVHALAGRRPGAAGRPPAPPSGPDKWKLLDSLRRARAAYGLSDRTLSVLQALLSFLPARVLAAGAGGLVAFPSNASLSARLNGMPESTLRRHLAGLVAAGLIRRQDSPNGKRYVRRTRAGEVVRAYGFDLAPLAARADEIRAEAQAAEAEAETLALLREDCGRALRAARAAVGDGGAAHVAGLAARLRRRQDEAGLLALLGELAALAATPGRAGERPQEADLPAVADPLSGAEDARIERHSQSQETGLQDSDPPRTARAAPDAGPTLAEIATRCPDLAEFAGRPLRSWDDLAAAAETVRPMLGIAEPLWRDACRRLGPLVAAAVLAAILQRGQGIRSPGAYFRAVAAGMAEGRASLAGLYRTLGAES